MTYNPITGEFYRDGVRVSPCICADGYALIRYAGKQWKAHRLAFHLLGVPIPAMVDHANQDRAANQWCNLREATASQNGRNSINSMMTLLQATYSWGGSGTSLSVRRPGQRSRAGHTSSSQASARGQG